MIQSIKPYLNYFGHFIVIISFIFLAKIIYQNFAYIRSIELSFNNISLFILLVLWGVVGYVLFAYTCVIQARIKYPKFTLLSSFKIIATTQIAKYIPGNIGHHIGRFYLSNKIFSSSDTLYFLFIENLVFIFAAITIGSFYFLFIDLPTYINTQSLFLSGILLLLILPLLYKLILKIKEKFNVVHTQTKALLIIFAIFLLTSMQGGISIYFILKVILFEPPPSLLLCISGFSISFLVGLIMPGAPAGIGIREYAFTVLFAPFIGEATALKAIIIFRLVSTATDISLYLVGKYITNKLQKLQIS